MQLGLAPPYMLPPRNRPPLLLNSPGPPEAIRDGKKGNSEALRRLWR